MVGIELQMISPTSFCQHLKDVAMATNFSGKIVAKLPTPFVLIALSFLNRMIYRYLNVHVNNVNDAAISCKNFVNFGPETLEKTWLICERFVRHGKKLAYLVEYLRIYWTNFYDLFTS